MADIHVTSHVTTMAPTISVNSYYADLQQKNAKKIIDSAEITALKAQLSSKILSLL